MFDGSEDAFDPISRFEELYGLGKGQALLFRPDGYSASVLTQGHAERLKEGSYSILQLH